MSEWSDFLNEQLSDPKIRKEWDALTSEFEAAQVLIDMKKGYGRDRVPEQVV